MCLEGFCQRHSSHDLIEGEDLGKKLTVGGSDGGGGFENGA